MRFLAATTLISILGALFAGPAAATLGDCATPGYLQEFDERIPDDPCEEITRREISFAGGTATIRFVRLARDDHGSDAGWLPLIDRLSNRLEIAMSAMGSVRLPDTTVLLTSIEQIDEPAAPDPADVQGEVTPQPSRTHAWAFSPAKNECLVTFFKLADRTSAEEFVFTLAHELFHCIQVETWPRTEMSVGGPATWWVEGSAEYFANLVEPGTGFSDGWVRAFSSATLQRSILDLSYHNVVVFFWLGDIGGPRRVFDFIDAMPHGPTGDAGAQKRALRSQLPLAQWVRFGEAFANREINQPGGRRLSYDVNVRTIVRINGPVIHPLSASAYTLIRENYAFEEGTTYELTFTGSDALKLRFKEGNDAFIDPPMRVRACDEDKIYLVLVLTVEDSAEGEMRVARPEELDEIACCLVGAWKPTDGSVRSAAAKMNSVAVRTGPNGESFSCDYAGGDWTLGFQPDGTGHITYNDLTNQCIWRSPQGTRVDTLVRRGQQKFQWDVRDRRAGIAKYGENGVTYTFTMQAGPMNSTRTYPDAGPSIPENGFAYTCTDETLNILGVYGIGSNEADHLRADDRR